MPTRTPCRCPYLLLSVGRHLATCAQYDGDWFHTSDDQYFASDADRRQHQRTLDEKAARQTVRGAVWLRAVGR